MSKFFSKVTEKPKAFHETLVHDKVQPGRAEQGFPWCGLGLTGELRKGEAALQINYFLLGLFSLE